LGKSFNYKGLICETALLAKITKIALIAGKSWRELAKAFLIKVYKDF
jgi:hypothetical protein